MCEERFIQTNTHVTQCMRVVSSSLSFRRLSSADHDVFVFRVGVLMKTAQGLEMPSPLSKHTEGLRVHVCV